ncbi:MAG: hypothetical protein LBD80_01760 [Tannerella sp.]|nr:hypothetical protein [Tannerella sp.]
MEKHMTDLSKKIGVKIFNVHAAVPVVLDDGFYVCGQLSGLLVVEGEKFPSVVFVIGAVCVMNVKILFRILYCEDLTFVAQFGILDYAGAGFHRFSVLCICRMNFPLRSN